MAQPPNGSRVVCAPALLQASTTRKGWSDDPIIHSPDQPDRQPGRLSVKLAELLRNTSMAASETSRHLPLVAVDSPAWTSHAPVDPAYIDTRPCCPPRARCRICETRETQHSTAQRNLSLVSPPHQALLYALRILAFVAVTSSDESGWRAGRHRSRRGMTRGSFWRLRVRAGRGRGIVRASKDELPLAAVAAGYNEGTAT